MLEDSVDPSIQIAEMGDTSGVILKNGKYVIDPMVMAPSIYTLRFVRQAMLTIILVLGYDLVADVKI